MITNNYNDDIIINDGFRDEEKTHRIMNTKNMGERRKRKDREEER